MTLKEYYAYNKAHRQAVIDTERKLRGAVSLASRLHDLDKLILFAAGLPKEVVSNLHRKLSTHHTENIWHLYNYPQMIYDWESARITKPDKPLNARETMEKYYPELRDKIEPVLNEFGL